MSVKLGEATAETPLEPSDEDVQSNVPFARRSCTFHYCPSKSQCLRACLHPYQDRHQHAERDAEASKPVIYSGDNNEKQEGAMGDDWGTHGGDSFLDMPHLLDYQVLTGDTPEELRMHVLALASGKSGWEPHGGVAVTYATYHTDDGMHALREVWSYSQAMVLMGFD